MLYFLFCQVFLIRFSLLLRQKCHHRHRRDVATFAADISAYPRKTLFTTPPSALRTSDWPEKGNLLPPLSTGSTPSSSWPNWPRRQFPGWVAGSLTLSRPAAISALFLHLQKEEAGNAEFVIYAIAISAMKFVALFAKQRYVHISNARVQGYEENKSLRAVSVMYRLALCFCYKVLRCSVISPLQFWTKARYNLPPSLLDPSAFCPKFDTSLSLSSPL